MEIRIKIGTGSSEYRAVVRKHKPPNIGEVFFLKNGANEPERVKCYDIDLALGPLYFVER